MPALAPVLDAIDKNLDRSLERLFELIRLKSVSTDPAFNSEVRKAAEWLAADLRSIGFEASVRDTIGHPMVVGHHDGPEGSGSGHPRRRCVTHGGRIGQGHRRGREHWIVIDDRCVTDEGRPRDGNHG